MPTPGILSKVETDCMNAPLQVQVYLQLAEGIAATGVPGSAEVQRWVLAAVTGIAQEQSMTLAVTVRVVSEAESAALNGGYRSKEGPTNVLAFPAATSVLPPEAMRELDEHELGDLVICLAVAEREAAAQGKSLQQHLAHLVVHGTLHLLGHDHVEDADAEAMEALERSVLASLGLPDPYAVNGA